MLRQFMRAKIHRATVTACNRDYIGSITIDADLLQAADIRPNELVHVLDLDNGARLETYVICGQPGSGVIALNGPAAHLSAVGHRLVIVAYALLEPHEVDQHVARVVVADEQNRPAQTLTYRSLLDQPVESL